MLNSNRNLTGCVNAKMLLLRVHVDCVEHVYQDWNYSCHRNVTSYIRLLPVTLCFTVNASPHLMVAIMKCVLCYIQKFHFSSFDEYLFSVNKCTLMNQFCCHYTAHPPGWAVTLLEYFVSPPPDNKYSHSDWHSSCNHHHLSH